MNIIRFTSTYKPDGKDYTKVTLWNRYIQNKTLLFTLFIPTAAAIYFLVSDPGPFWWMFVLIMFYPLYSIIGFLFKIKKHLKFRNPADIAKTEFTFMNNGILADRMEMQNDPLGRRQYFMGIKRLFPSIPKRQIAVCICKKRYGAWARRCNTGIYPKTPF